MSRPSKFGKSGHSFDSETSVFTTPPLSPRSSQLVTYNSGGAHGGHHHQHHHAGAAHHSNDSAGRPTYYVQSPSRDSFTFNEGDSLSQSFAAKSSPSGSPLASPLHKTISSKPHRHQAAVYGNPRPGSRRVLPQPNNVAGAAHGAPIAAVNVVPHKKGYQPWNGGTIQEEEEHRPPGSTERRRGVSRWYALLLSIASGIVCIVIVGFVYWLVCRPSAPKVDVKSISLQSFSIDQGNDPTGVPTQVLSANVLTTLSYHNPSKYFGFHVSAPEATLSYQQITVAEGKNEKFFQKKRSSSTISLEVNALRTPVYGTGPNLLSTFSSGEGLPLQLRIRVQSEARVIWKIVRPRYRSHIACDLVVDTNSKLDTLKIQSQNCHRG